MSKIEELLERVGVDVGYCPDGWIELGQEVQKLLAVVQAGQRLLVTSKEMEAALAALEKE